MKIDFNKVIKNLEGKAKKIYVDKKRLKRLLSSAIRIIEENKQLKEIVEDIKLMVQLLKDWGAGNYKDLSKNNIVLVIVALLYLVMPLDLIPDFLPMGFIDDIAVISFIMKKMSDEISKYKRWKTGLEEEIIQEEEFDLQKEKQDLDNDFYIEL